MYKVKFWNNKQSRYDNMYDYVPLEKIESFDYAIIYNSSGDIVYFKDIYTINELVAGTWIKRKVIQEV